MLITNNVPKGNCVYMACSCSDMCDIAIILVRCSIFILVVVAFLVVILSLMPFLLVIKAVLALLLP